MLPVAARLAWDGPGMREAPRWRTRRRLSVSSACWQEVADGFDDRVCGQGERPPLAVCHASAVGKSLLSGERRRPTCGGPASGELTGPLPAVAHAPDETGGRPCWSAVVSSPGVRLTIRPQGSAVRPGAVGHGWHGSARLTCWRNASRGHTFGMDVSVWRRAVS
ncbi:hypothetical protein SMALA_8399 [Streptomyces malaysiensis subsp. malaysiensis]|nr:hypothetical protein SMALA_8399 [Streptomyces malaysiensis]